MMMGYFFSGRIEMSKNYKWNCSGWMVLSLSLAALLATTWQATPAWAQGKGGGGGGSTSGGNATAVWDETTNTLSVTGDGNPNLINITLYDGLAYIGGVGYTKINGGDSQKFQFPVADFTLVMDGAAGNDRLWITVITVEMAARLRIVGGGGNDWISVSTSNGPSGLATLEVDGGAGDDLVEIAVNGDLWIDGPLTVLAGDGADQVKIGPLVSVTGVATLDGGKRQDQLTMSPDLFAAAMVSSFETILFW